LGYAEATTCHESLFGPRGTTLRGHRFHWSEVIPDPHTPALFDLRNSRGTLESANGIQIGNLHASYFHPHFASNPAALDAWVSSMTATRKR
ncbi:MAG: cobyrinate a,c-diamide synthase, partial [Puniceicoccales bacterium]